MSLKKHIVDSFADSRLCFHSDPFTVFSEAGNELHLNAEWSWLVPFLKLY